MNITQLKAQVKNPERVSVFVDNAYSFSLTVDQLLAQKLQKGLEISERRLEELKKLSDEGKIRMKALEWVMGRPHSVKELREYLYRKKVDADFAVKITEEFVEKKYISDEQFARWFSELRLRKNKSMRAIQAELAAKGIAKDVAAMAISELNVAEKDSEQIKALVSKLRHRSRYQDEKKLIAYLIGKGFSYADIKEVLAGS